MKKRLSPNALGPFKRREPHRTDGRQEKDTMAKVFPEGASLHQQRKDFEDNKIDETIKGEIKVFVDAGTNPGVSFHSGGFVGEVVPKGAASRKGVESGFSLLRILGVQNEVFKIEENLTESGLRAKIAEFVQLGHPYQCIFAKDTSATA